MMMTWDGLMLVMLCRAVIVVIVLVAILLLVAKVWFLNLLGRVYACPLQCSMVMLWVVSFWVRLVKGPPGLTAMLWLPGLELRMSIMFGNGLVFPGRVSAVLSGPLEGACMIRLCLISGVLGGSGGGGMQWSVVGMR